MGKAEPDRGLKPAASRTRMTSIFRFWRRGGACPRRGKGGDKPRPYIGHWHTRAAYIFPATKPRVLTRGPVPPNPFVVSNRESS
jgi:hypothetical protein